MLTMGLVLNLVTGKTKITLNKIEVSQVLVLAYLKKIMLIFLQLKLIMNIK